MNWDTEKVQLVVDTVAASEEGEVITDASVFWAYFGVEDRMAALQEEIAERLAAEGISVSFEVVTYATPVELPLRMEFPVPAAPAPLDLKADTLRALSIRQPWVELILSGEKNLEYRSRRMREMGPLLVHASRTFDPLLFEGRDLDPEVLPFGALVGVVDVVGCMEVDGEEGLFAYQLAHPRRFAAPIPYSGAAGIFRVPLEQVSAALKGSA